MIMFQYKLDPTPEPSDEESLNYKYLYHHDDNDDDQHHHDNVLG